MHMHCNLSLDESCSWGMYYVSSVVFSAELLQSRFWMCGHIIGILSYNVVNRSSHVVNKSPIGLHVYSYIYVQRVTQT